MHAGHGVETQPVRKITSDTAHEICSLWTLRLCAYRASSPPAYQEGKGTDLVESPDTMQGGACQRIAVDRFVTFDHVPASTGIRRTVCQPTSAAQTGSPVAVGASPWVLFFAF